MILYGNVRQREMLAKIQSNSKEFGEKINDLNSKGITLTEAQTEKLYNLMIERYNLQMPKIDEAKSETPVVEEKSKDDWRVSKDEKFKMMDERWG